jgi:hypothetical protein
VERLGVYMDDLIRRPGLPFDRRERPVARKVHPAGLAKRSNGHTDAAGYHRVPHFCRNSLAPASKCLCLNAMSRGVSSLGDSWRSGNFNACTK